MTRTPAHARLRRVAVPAVLAAAVAAALATPPAQAAGGTSAVCTNRFTAWVTPGFTPIPGTGTISSHGQTGSITCAGRIAGHRVTGPGTVGIDYVYTNGSCTGHIGEGTVRVDIPTTAGMKHLVGALSVRRTALALRALARFGSQNFHGVGVIVPTRGTCVVTPLSQALVSVTGVLSGP
jgi:hypothetical protein